MKAKALISTSLATILFAASCEWRPLEEPNSQINLQVVVDIKAVLNVNTSIYNKYIPVPEIKTQMVRVLFYDPNTHKLVSQAFLSDEIINDKGEKSLCGNINISPGTYDMICYNFDMPDTFIRGENDINSLEAYTSEVPSSLKAQYGQNIDPSIDILFEPDHVIVTREIGLRIRPHSGVLVIETQASSVIDTYYIQCRITGAKWASDATAVLTGLSRSNYIGLGQRNRSNPCATYFQMIKSQDPNIVGTNQDVICATFNTFGKLYSDQKSKTKDSDEQAIEDSELSLTFNIVRTDGKIFNFDVDMNDLFLSEDAIERHWLLIEKVIDIPEPENPGGESGAGGFQPVIEDWDNEEGEIVI